MSGEAPKRGIAPKRWHVQSIDPRDHFETCTLTVEQWFANVRGCGQPRAIENAWVDLMGAIRALTDACSANDWQLRTEPRVAYDFPSDTHYFIFKMREDGATFIISDRPLEYDLTTLNDTGPIMWAAPSGRVPPQVPPTISTRFTGPGIEDGGQGNTGCGGV